MTYVSITTSLPADFDPNRIIICNPEGPIHFKTLCRALGLDTIPDIDRSDGFREYDVDMNAVLALWEKIKQSVKPPTPILPIPKMPDSLEDTSSSGGASFDLIVYVEQYLKHKSTSELEGKSLENIANTIARLAPKSPAQAQAMAQETIPALKILGEMGTFDLSVSKTHVGPTIPKNIDELAAGGETAEEYFEDLCKYHAHTLIKIYTFDKLVNMIANSCLRRLCEHQKSQAPAYYTAAKFVKRCRNK